MNKHYNVGIDSNTVTIQVAVGTAATCYTCVNQCLADGQEIRKAESTATSNGAIDKKPVDTAATLKGTSLLVQTTVDFSAMPDDVIQTIQQDHQAVKTYLTITYTIDGGFDGQQVCHYDDDDFVVATDGKMVMVTKQFDLVSQ